MTVALLAFKNYIFDFVLYLKIISRVIAEEVAMWSNENTCCSRTEHDVLEHR